MYTNLPYLIEDLHGVVSRTGERLQVENAELLRQEKIDRLVATAVFASHTDLKEAARKTIREIAQAVGIYPASHYQLYQEIAAGKHTGFTIPAINLRTMTYDMAHTIFHLMLEHKIGPVIFEIARSEMEYTEQTPDEFAVAVLAAAIKAGYTGPVFIQGDHDQVNEKAFYTDAPAEKERLQELIKSSMDAGFLNIDIDGSTIVDLSQAAIADQQLPNSTITAELTTFIRTNSPEGVTISIGGEIGHIGDKNSTPEDFTAFMDQYLPRINGAGLSKVSVQTGTSHGGTVNPDGTIDQPAVDFSIHTAISQLAKEKYQMAGTVQHGASTLPTSSFHEFPAAHTVEIHFSTGLQNVVYDTMPTSLKETIYTWLRDNCVKERKPEWTDAQFFYKTRKKALGPFKASLWQMEPEQKKPILTALETFLGEMFEQLGIFNTEHVLATYAK